jgi:hypothetical protein
MERRAGERVVGSVERAPRRGLTMLKSSDAKGKQ